MGEVIRDVDWKTIVFLAAIFTLVQAFIKTELLQGLSIQLYGWFGANVMPVAFLSLAGIGILSSLLANIPVVAAALVMITGYLVTAETVPEIALAAGFTDWPNTTLPVFVAMMFGGTLGGNATLIGASANVVAVGICVAHGKRVTFMQFLRIGLPIAVAQLLIGALYVWVLPRFWTDPFPGCRVRYPGFVLLQGTAQGVDRFVDSSDPPFVGFRVIDGLLDEGLSPFQGLDRTDQLWHWA
ncbi:MAG: hypothetical protein R3F40_06985 [Candidatus Competibacteraceae bacterium]